MKYIIGGFIALTFLLTLPLTSATCVNDIIILDIASKLNMTTTQTVEFQNIFEALCERDNSNAHRIDIINNRTMNYSVTEDINTYMNNYTSWINEQIGYKQTINRLIEQNDKYADIINISVNSESIKQIISTEINKKMSDLDAKFIDLNEEVDGKINLVITEKEMNRTVEQFKSDTQAMFISKDKEIKGAREAYWSTVSPLLFVVFALIAFLIWNEKRTRQKLAEKIEKDPAYQAISGEQRKFNSDQEKILEKRMEEYAEMREEDTMKKEKQAIEETVERDKKSKAAKKGNKPTEDNKDYVN